jgi:hypothetical protein
LAGQGEKVSIDYYLTRDLSITTSTTYGKGSASGTGASGTSANNNEIGLSWHRIY